MIIVIYTFWANTGGRMRYGWKVKDTYMWSSTTCNGKPQNGISKEIVCDVFYYCRLPEKGDMVCCDYCQECFHITCINSCMRDENDWFCSSCSDGLSAWCNHFHEYSFSITILYILFIARNFCTAHIMILNVKQFHVKFKGESNACLRMRPGIHLIHVLQAWLNGITWYLTKERQSIKQIIQIPENIHTNHLLAHSDILITTIVNKCYKNHAGIEAS